ncbi:uncharacterized protein EV422DRAFT_503847 [Fimicolochytrium jonesii]|uniref:uncharacterized protein n=1 Tax=Fimicolochytrium jonesii TaxID=1396493 RepID=UPI0022FE33E7|nr:uncharacterized protein EV422DRAFT_503847 [Fimicolochytrium jonesii]KAI8825083.1 hypothetical protein EV422DRAFT_503847 [Fimicolochytrium jonesii]
MCAGPNERLHKSGSGSIFNGYLHAGEAFSCLGKDEDVARILLTVFEVNIESLQQTETSKPQQNPALTPAEAFPLILSYLPLTTLIRGTTVSRTWPALLRRSESRVWAALDFSAYPDSVSDAVLRPIARMLQTPPIRARRRMLATLDVTRCTWITPSLDMDILEATGQSSTAVDLTDHARQRPNRWPEAQASPTKRICENFGENFVPLALKTLDLRSCEVTDTAVGLVAGRWWWHHSQILPGGLLQRWGMRWGGVWRDMVANTTSTMSSYSVLPIRTPVGPADGEAERDGNINLGKLRISAQGLKLSKLSLQATPSAIDLWRALVYNAIDVHLRSRICRTRAGGRAQRGLLVPVCHVWNTSIVGAIHLRRNGFQDTDGNLLVRVLYIPQTERSYIRRCSPVMRFSFHQDFSDNSRHGSASESLMVNAIDAKCHRTVSRTLPYDAVHVIPRPQPTACAAPIIFAEPFHPRASPYPEQSASALNHPSAAAVADDGSPGGERDYLDAKSTLSDRFLITKWWRSSDGRDFSRPKLTARQRRIAVHERANIYIYIYATLGVAVWAENSGCVEGCWLIQNGGELRLDLESRGCGSGLDMQRDLGKLLVLTEPLRSRETQPLNYEVKPEHQDSRHLRLDLLDNTARQKRPEAS